MGTDNISYHGDCPKPKKSRPSVDNISGSNWNCLPTVILHEVFLRLNHPDRIHASSVCRNWRQVLYHPLWWKNVIFRINENHLPKIRYLTSAFGHITTNATIKFDPMSTICVDEFISILLYLAENNALKSLIIEPKFCRIDLPPFSAKGSDQMDVEKVVNLLKNCCHHSIERFSYGCIEKFTPYVPQFLEILTTNSPKKVTHLGLASVREEPGNHKPMSIDLKYFKAFTKLQVLSIDYDIVSNAFLQTLESAADLKRLVVHINGVSKDHPGTTDDAWLKFRSQHQNCELRVTLIHAYKEVKYLERILKSCMPLTHLKVFFCEYVNLEVLHKLSAWYPNTFRSLVWVDSLCRNDNPNAWAIIREDEIPIAQNGHQPDPIVMIAWLCSKLEEIVLLGYKYHEEDLVAIARLRSDTLKVLEVGHKDVLYSCPGYISYLNSREEVPMLMGNPTWAPLTAEKLHPVICDPTAGDSDEYLLPKVLADLQ